MYLIVLWKGPLVNPIIRLNEQKRDNEGLFLKNKIIETIDREIPDVSKIKNTVACKLPLRIDEIVPVKVLARILKFNMFLENI